MRKLLYYSVITSLLLITVAIPDRAYAGAQISSRYLLHVCERDSKGKETVKGGHATCQAYIAGVIDYHTLLRSLGTSPNIDFCIPSKANLGQLQTIVLNYLKRNPQHNDFIASPAVSLALYEAYPCKKK